MYSYYLGLDLGQRRDYTALCIIEEPVWIPPDALEPDGWAWHLNLEEEVSAGGGWLSPETLNPARLQKAISYNYYGGKPHQVPLSVRHLERLPLKTPYPQVIEHISQMLARAPLRERPAALIVDATGVGVSVIDSFVQAGLSPIAVTIHGGDKVSYEPPTLSSAAGFRVPKRDLVGAAQVLFQSGRLRIAEGLSEAATLKEELLNFKVEIDPKTAHDSYSHWREGDHDDLVLATAMAAWYRQFYNRHIDAQNAEIGVPGPVPGLQARTSEEAV